MTVNIPPEFEAYVEQELKDGAYQSREELICDALSLFRELRGRFQSLRSDVQHAVDQADRGEVLELDLEDLIARGTARLRAKGIVD